MIEQHLMWKILFLLNQDEKMNKINQDLNEIISEYWKIGGWGTHILSRNVVLDYGLNTNKSLSCQRLTANQDIPIGMQNR